MFEEEEKKCLKGIIKCDEVLSKWDMRGYKRHKSIKVCEYANEVPPQKVAATFKRLNKDLEDCGCDADPDYFLVIFYANAKCDFILRLVQIREQETKRCAYYGVIQKQQELRRKTAELFRLQCFTSMVQTLKKSGIGFFI